MSRREAAETLVEMAALLRRKGYWENEYIEAVALACGVLMVDDVLPPKEVYDDLS